MNKVPVEIHLVQPDRLSDCLAVFDDSPLHRSYFAGSDRLACALQAAVAKRQLLAAFSSSGEIIGAMQVDPTGFMGICPYLALLGVKKGFRGMGVGHTLLEVFEGISRELGCDKAALMVSHFNPRAKKLYQSMGYRKVGYLENAIKPGIHENIMVKSF